MHDRKTKMKQMQSFLKIKRSFYSLCRNQEIIESDSDEINKIIEDFKNNYSNINVYTYIWMLDRLHRMVRKNELSKNEALYIAIHVIDPSYRMYSLYEENCNFKDFKKLVIDEFNFFDDDFFKIEKEYVDKNNLKKEYNWALKKEV